MFCSLANYLNKIAVCFLVILFVCSASAQADGAFDGIYKSSSGPAVRLVLKKELSAYSINYYAALFVGKDQAGLFRIDQYDAATYALTQMHVGSQHILKMNENLQPSYSMKFTDMNGKKILILARTPTGAQNRCPDSMQMILDSSSSESWVGFKDIPSQGLRVNRDAKIDIILTQNAPLREYAVEMAGGDDMNKQWTGQYILREPIEGLGLLRSRQIDSMNTSGFQVTRSLVTILLALRVNNKPSIRFVNMSPASSLCLSKSSNLF